MLHELSTHNNKNVTSAKIFDMPTAKHYAGKNFTSVYEKQNSPREEENFKATFQREVGKNFHADSKNRTTHNEEVNFKEPFHKTDKYNEIMKLLDEMMHTVLRACANKMEVKFDPKAEEIRTGADLLVPRQQMWEEYQRMEAERASYHNALSIPVDEAKLQKMDKHTAIVLKIQLLQGAINALIERLGERNMTSSGEQTAGVVKEYVPDPNIRLIDHNSFQLQYNARLQAIAQLSSLSNSQ
ncbi:MAG: hypothetical protein LBH98_07520 [Chitinispirillales bacterium]|jgi:hypothetical protein|nr:hypothetical protein [Chitinispirillales bacterium]